MVILMAAGEEAEHGDAFRIERGRICRQIWVLLQNGIEAGGNVALLDQAPPRVR